MSHDHHIIIETHSGTSLGSMTATGFWPGFEKTRGVALARAFALKPGILLLNELSGAVDRRIRKGLHNWLRKLQAADQLILVSSTNAHLHGPGGTRGTGHATWMTCPTSG